MLTVCVPLARFGEFHEIPHDEFPVFLNVSTVSGVVSSTETWNCPELDECAVFKYTVVPDMRS